MSNLIRITHAAMVNSDVIVASQHNYAKAGRTMSGLLKAAAKAGEIRVDRSYGPVTGTSVIYYMTSKQIDELRNEAIRRVKNKIGMVK